MARPTTRVQTLYRLSGVARTVEAMFDVLDAVQLDEISAEVQPTDVAGSAALWVAGQSKRLVAGWCRHAAITVSLPVSYGDLRSAGLLMLAVECPGLSFHPRDQPPSLAHPPPGVSSSQLRLAHPPQAGHRAHHRHQPAPGRVGQYAQHLPRHEPGRLPWYLPDHDLPGRLRRSRPVTRWPLSPAVPPAQLLPDADEHGMPPPPRGHCLGVTASAHLDQRADEPGPVRRALDLPVQDRIQLRTADAQLPGQRHRIVTRGLPQLP